MGDWSKLKVRMKVFRKNLPHQTETLLMNIFFYQEKAAHLGSKNYPEICKLVKKIYI